MGLSEYCPVCDGPLLVKSDWDEDTGETYGWLECRDCGFEIDFDPVPEQFPTNGDSNQIQDHLLREMRLAQDKPFYFKELIALLHQKHHLEDRQHFEVRRAIWDLIDKGDIELTEDLAFKARG